LYFFSGIAVDLCMNLLERIEIHPQILAGKPVIKGTRISVHYILGLLTHGESPESIVKDHPNITTDDVYACIEFASEVLQDTSFVLFPKERAKG
jgi:uncharacterized protein (DUF433 family)